MSIIKKGTVFLDLIDNEYCIALADSEIMEVVPYASDSCIRGIRTRDEISLATGNMELFVPLCIKMPCGLKEDSNGSFVLFNKYLQPLWIIESSGEISDPDLNMNINDFGGEYFYNTPSNPEGPWASEESLRVCNEVLRKWGVLNRISLLERTFLKGEYKYFIS